MSNATDLQAAWMGDAVCGLCGRKTLRADEAGIDCTNCVRSWDSPAAYLAELDRKAVEFALENPEFRDRTASARTQLHRICVALLRRLDTAEAERLALAIGRLADFSDATSRAILSDAAREEANRLRALRGAAA